ncbi:MAG: hypothetical protein ACOYXR_02550 [Nitrospirota bacterium]
MRLVRLVTFLATIAWSATLVAGEPLAQTIRFDVTDPRDEITRDIDAALMLRVVRVRHERGSRVGWEVQVVERARLNRRNNLLRDHPSSGGPHPSDVLAWLSRERRFPDDRTLRIPGQPYEIRIRLIDCRTEQIGDDASFVSGTIEISWRRLDLAGAWALQKLSSVIDQSF